MQAKIFQIQNISGRERDHIHSLFFQLCLRLGRTDCILKDENLTLERLSQTKGIPCFGGNVTFEMFKANSMNGKAAGDTLEVQARSQHIGNWTFQEGKYTLLVFQQNSLLKYNRFLSVIFLELSTFFLYHCVIFIAQQVRV